MSSRMYVSVMMMQIAGLWLAATGEQARAALIASYQFESASPLANTAPSGPTTDRPNLTDPGGTQSPTHLSNGGRAGTGAYQFDGAADPDGDHFGFGGAGALFLGYNNNTTTGPTPPNNHDWTLSFWIKTTDSGTFPDTAHGGYDGTPQVPILGDTSNNIAMSLGIDAGVANFRWESAGWHSNSGSTLVADGAPHYVTFVAHGNYTLLDIYVDGELDIANQALPNNVPGGGRQLGVSYFPHAGAFTLDDLRLYDEALDAGTINELFAIPEPTGIGMILLCTSAMTLARRRLV